MDTNGNSIKLNWLKFNKIQSELSACTSNGISVYVPDGKVHGANMGPTWVLSAPDGPHVGPMNLAIRGVMQLLIHVLASVVCHVEVNCHWGLGMDE